MQGNPECAALFLKAAVFRSASPRAAKVTVRIPSNKALCVHRVGRFVQDRSKRLHRGPSRHQGLLNSNQRCAQEEFPVQVRKPVMRLPASSLSRPAMHPARDGALSGHASELRSVQRYAARRVLLHAGGERGFFCESAGEFPDRTILDVDRVDGTRLAIISRGHAARGVPSQSLLVARHSAWQFRAW